MDEQTETLYWHVRITMPHTMKPKILDLIESQGSAYILACEISQANVEHFQAITQIPCKKELTKRLNEMGVAKGNKGRMCSKLRESLPRAVSYLLKDNDYVTKGFSKEIIEEAKKIHSEFIAKQTKASKLSKLDQLRELIKRDLKITKLDDKEIYVSIDNDGTERCVTEEFILDKVLEFYQQSKCLVREFYIISVVQTLSLEFVNYFPMLFRTKLLEKIRM